MTTKTSAARIILILTAVITVFSLLLPAAPTANAAAISGETLNPKTSDSVIIIAALLIGSGTGLMVFAHKKEL